MNTNLIKIFTILIILLSSGCAFADDIDYVKGIVIDIIAQNQNAELKETMGGDQIEQILKVKILSGEFQGKEVLVENQLTSNPAYDIDIHKNDRVLVGIENINDKKKDFYIADKERVPILYFLSGLFFLLLLIVGGKKGVNSIVSLLMTGFLIFSVLIPFVMKGYPVLPVTVLVSIFSTAITMFVVGGLNLKSIGATLGTIISLFLAGLLSLFVIKYGYLTGFGSQESQMLWTSNPKLNFKGILSASMIIASLGAIMDIGMSIASCINEIKKTNNSLTIKELVKSGMNVGKDIVGTMASTLILAYIGSSFFLFLLLENVPVSKFLNLNSVASEISAAIVGSIGIVLCVPITAIVTSYLLTIKKK
ncbi:MAG: YibE/F family protein [Candidatus Gastranaerophilaceae bacterium]|jgi:uncharacterized membrane protein